MSDRIADSLLTRRVKLLGEIDEKIVDICMIDVALATHGIDVTKLPVVGYLRDPHAPAVKGHAAPESI